MVNDMDYTKATDQQIKVILEDDGECPPLLLREVMEEAVRRDLYSHYMIRMLNNWFKAVRFAEHTLKLTFDEIKYTLYMEAFNALRFYKPGKGSFKDFWVRFMINAVRREKRQYEAEKRTAEFFYIDEDPGKVQLIDDHNTERKAVNRVYIGWLLSKLTEEEQNIVLQYNKDRTFKEIGNGLGRSTEYARKKYYKSIEKLKAMGA